MLQWTAPIHSFKNIYLEGNCLIYYCFIRLLLNLQYSNTRVSTSYFPISIFPFKKTEFPFIVFF